MSSKITNFHFTVKTVILDSGWKVFYYDEISDLLFLNGKLRDNARIKLESFSLLNSDFKSQIFIEGISILLSTCSEKKEFRFAHVRAANEIFVIDQIESSENVETLKIKESEGYKAFKSHVQEITKISIDSHPSVSKLVEAQNNLESLEVTETKEINARAKEITKNLISKLEEYKPVFFESLTDFCLSLTARYALLRVHLLKFLAILPSLDHDKAGVEVKRILIEALRRLMTDSKASKKLNLKGENAALPTILVAFFYFALFAAKIIPAKALAALVRFKVRFMAKRFIAGETIELAQKNFSQIFSTGRDVTLDQLGELVVSEPEADHYMDEVLKLIRGFGLHLSRGEKNSAGILRAHVSIKVSALCSDFKPEAFEYTYKLVAPRLKNILLEAKEHEVFINIDAEHYHYRDIVFKVYKKLLLETLELKNFAHTGIVIQAYLRDGVSHLIEVVELAKERGITMPVRLVKGAYWDAETVEAKAHGHEAPEFLNKEETDIHFRQMVNEIFKNHPHIQICLASHNFSDHSYAVALRELRYPETPLIEHQCLHMTYEALSIAMSKMNWTVRNYVPIGSLIVGMAYLVRRIMENSSQVGVLTIMRSHKKKVSLLSPTKIFNDNYTAKRLVYDETITNLDGSYFNIPPLRTYLDDERETMNTSLENFLDQNSSRRLGQVYQTPFCTGQEQTILSPSDNETIVGKIKFATIDDTQDAIMASENEYYDGDWSKLDFSLRAAIFMKASSLFLSKRNMIASIIMYESGKSFLEAQGDVDEAIDFINFYIREQKKLKDEKIYHSRGPSAIIAPWNFPFAIPCGMSVAALLTGSTVILKSSEQTPIIAAVLVELLHEAGVSEKALIHLPGLGESVGEHLINAKEISTIIFTGSKAVGIHISKAASKRLYYNKKKDRSYPVKVITEMGGKNGLIVTSNAELDETVSGILKSAFAHAGQKCSACSRVLVDNRVKDRLTQRLASAAKDLNVGKSTDFSIFINPLISKKEKSRLITQVREAVVEANENGGTVHIDRSSEDLPGNCVGPVVIELPANTANAKDSYAKKELFAPVIHVIGFDNLDQAISIFNSTEYALTGGVYSQSQDDIDYLTEKMLCGNIYINRPITGARVGIEPFGGFKLSGTGPKAGGVDYLRSLNLSLNKGEEVKSLEEKGSDFSVVFAKSSGLNYKGRVERAINSLDSIISNMGPLFPGVFGKDKEKLQKLRGWLTKDFYDYVEKNRLNRVIPGQLNYSKFDKFKKTCVYIEMGERPSINSFVQFFAALSAGLGLTILCTNHKSYVWWKYLIDKLIKNRFSKRNIDCYYINAKSIKRSEGQCVDVFIVNTDEEGFESVKNYISSFIGQKKVPRVLLPFEDSGNTLSELFQPFTNERSFAVNVMRHGAPMDLDL